MLFSYEELKSYVEEDAVRFRQMGFEEAQILPAVLEEYRHGEDFDSLENLCIHLTLALCFQQWRLDGRGLIAAVRRLLEEGEERERREALGGGYAQYRADLETLMPETAEC